MISIRRLAAGDEHLVEELARDEVAFELEEPGSTRAALEPVAAQRYLADDHVLHWVAEDGDVVVGHLLCYLEHRWIGDPAQLLLYEIGVRQGRRRQGIGRALIGEMERWMAAEGVREVWVLSDEEAEGFYRACGFERDQVQPVQMTRRL
jgi:predicted N-acetyltransferase YhbS